MDFVVEQNVAADTVVMAEALRLLVGGSAPVDAVTFSLLCQWLTRALLSYVAVVLTLATSVQRLGHARQPVARAELVSSCTNLVAFDRPGIPGRGRANPREAIRHCCGLRQGQWP